MLPRKAPTAEMILVAKAFCSLRRNVALPFQGTITALEVHAGQAVREGDVLARCRLTPETVLYLRQKTVPVRLERLETKLDEVRKRFAELTEVRQAVEKSPGLSQAFPRESLDSIQRQLQHLSEEEAVIREELEFSRQSARKDLEVFEIPHGTTAAPAKAPEEAALIAPISGHVVWVHPDMRPGAELAPVNPAFVVGVMDPMILRARVYEEETLRLELGDKATVLPESLPGRKLKAQVSRISWSPVSLEPLEPSYYDVEFIAANPDLILREGMRLIIRVYKPLSRPAQGMEDNPSDNGSVAE